MLAQLEGVIAEKEIGYVVLNVGGVGYKVHTGIADVGKEGERVRLWTHLAVREDALDLYGFIDKESLRFFEQLIKVSGIGPKSAMNILSVASLETLLAGIAEGDVSYLTKVSGIGKKTAEKIVLELRDKVPASGYPASSLQGESDVLEALISLGYARHQAQSALRKLPKSSQGPSDRIREALKLLGTKS